MFPKIRNAEPRYDQISLPQKVNDLIQIISPNKDDDGVWIHQEAWFHIGNLKQGWEGTYQLKGNNHGVYAFVIDGKTKIADHE